MTELILDNSEEVISLDKPTLYFNIDPSTKPDNNGVYGKAECTMTVKNLVNSNVAVRTKTTKKDVYAVNPTYGIIPPNGTLEIKFVYYIKDLNDDPKKHKFKFEGIVADNSITEKDVKGLFESCIGNRTKAKGSAIKREVTFNYIKRENVASNAIPINSSNLSNILPEAASDSNKQPDVIPTSKGAQGQKINGNDKKAETQLQDLKMELHKYKNQLTNLTETHKNLKSRVEMEKSKDTQTNLNFSTSEEKQISKNIGMILFAVSIILGFILSR